MCGPVANTALVCPLPGCIQKLVQKSASAMLSDARATSGAYMLSAGVSYNLGGA